MFILHLCSAMLLIYSNYHHNSFCSYKFSFLQVAKSVLASTLFTSLCAFLFHPVFAAFSLFLPFFTFLGRMYVYARSLSSCSGSNIGIKALTSYRFNKIIFLWICDGINFFVLVLHLTVPYTRGLYTFYPIFEGQKCLFKELFFVKF